MCGIVGYISTADNIYQEPKRHFMRFALALDTLRGHDSTGIMTLQNKFKVSVVKTTMPGDRFVHSDKYKKQVEPGWAQVGHNRAATKGSVKLDNAHPFVFGNIVLVHNGTLFKSGSSLPTFDQSLEVDSMQIAHALNEHTPDDVKAVLEDIDGSFALVWFDKRDQSVNMARNTDRPLHFAYNQNKTVMWFMSDGHHLHSVNKSLRGHESAGSTVYQLDKHKILKFKKGTLVPEVTAFVPFDWQARQRAAREAAEAAAARFATTKDNKSTSDSSPGTTRLQQSTEKWQETLRQANGASTKKSTSGIGSFPMVDVRTNIAGIERKIPEPMLQALDDEFGLPPTELLEFRPLDIFELGDHKMMVHGYAVLKEWGDVEWPAMIHNVREAQAKAYMSYSWLVRPVGVGHPMEGTGKAPSLLCHLIHCKWHDYEKRLKEEEAAEEGKVDYPPEADIQVPGPGGSYVSARRLRQLQDSGCTNCGHDIRDEDIVDCVYVNEARDLLCKPCQVDLERGICRAILN